MNTAHFSKQVHVFFWKTVRIANREKFWKSLIFAAIIAVLVTAVVSKGMYESYNATHNGFFTLVCACIWIGLFNTIQNVCKEHEIIHADARAGMSIAAYVLSSVLWQMILCLMEAIIIFGISMIFIPYAASGANPLLIGYLPELFLTVYFLLLASACLGLMISSIANNGTMAMIIMPFVLILQLIFCGVLFDLQGVASVIGFLTLSKWGMSAFGSISGMVNMPFKPGDAAEKTLNEANQKGMMFEKQSGGAYKHEKIVIPPPDKPEFANESGVLILAWVALIALAVLAVVGTIIILKQRNKES